MRDESLDPDPESAFFLGIIYLMYALVGIPANLFIVFATLANKSLRSVNINLFIITLCSADAILLFFCCSSLLWALTFDTRACQIGGYGYYVFALLNIITPSCLAITRYAVLLSSRTGTGVLSFLTQRRGVLLVNGSLWTFVIVYPIPFVIANKFGLDAMGVCGIESFNSIPLLLYYTLGILCVMCVSYFTTLIFYRKLDRWIRETASSMTSTSATEETIQVTRSLLTMTKWLTLLPFVVVGPALIIESLLRYDPLIVSMRTARFFMIPVPLTTVCDPFITVYFVGSYRQYFLRLLRWKRANITNAIVSVNAQPYRASLSVRRITF